jgi:hypothetical protein
MSKAEAQSSYPDKPIIFFDIIGGYVSTPSSASCFIFSEFKNSERC